MNGLIYISKLNDGNFEYGMHSHPSWELIYFTEGEGYVVTEEERYPFSAGTVVCIPPDTLHGDIAEGRYKNIHLNTESAFYSQKKVCTFQDNASHDLKQLLELTFNIFMQPDMRFKELCETLFASVEKYVALMLDTPEDEYSICVNVMSRRILENLSDFDFQIDRVFEGLPYSPDHLRRLFKRKYGCTLRSFLITNRIELAKRLLKENNSIAHVAAMVGFSDAYYFSRIFKETTGLAPSYWLKENQ